MRKVASLFQFPEGEKRAIHATSCLKKVIRVSIPRRGKASHTPNFRRKARFLNHFKPGKEQKWPRIASKYGNQINIRKSIILTIPNMAVLDN